ncbi:hypothetical protein GCM10020000_19480 [Streptomyces olivoverticillatus]
MTGKPNCGGSPRRETSTGRAAGQQGDGLLDLLVVHAHARVVDDDGGAVVHGLEADLDGGVGLGVPGRVVEEFGDGEHDGLHGPADDREVDLAVHAYAAVVADPRGGAPYDVGERGGDALAAGPGAAQHGDGLGAAAELGVGVVDLQQVAQHVGVVVPVLHVRDGQLLFVGEALEGAHGRLERGLGGLVSAGLGPVDGLGEVVHHGLEAVREVGAGQPVVERAGQRYRGPGGVRDGGQSHADQVPYLLVTRPDALFELVDAPAHSGGDRPLAHQQDRDGGQRDGQTPDHHLRYVM